MNTFELLANEILQGREITREEAGQLLQTPAADLLPLLCGAYTIRSHFHQNKVRIHVLKNAKSGLCPEDCSFCSQSSKAKTPVNKYKLLSKEEIVSGARAAKEMNAYKYCIVTSTKTPSPKELDTICDAVREIKETIDIRICASLGSLSDIKASLLQEAGVNNVNHNLESSERMFPSIVSTHSYQDRIATVERVRKAGMETCCGGIVGMNETEEDILDLAFRLKELKIDSIPVNFLNPREGTAMDAYRNLNPTKCLTILSMFRYVHPDKDIRVAGGREVNLRALQPFALYAANSMFTEGYLTTGGNSSSKDIQMIEDMGFEVET